MATVKKILIDMVPVFLGVIIALFLNNWKENLDNQRFLERVFSAIEQEMSGNLQDLNAVLPRQQAFLDTLERYLDNPKITISEVLSKTRGLQAATIRTTSWYALRNSKIELIDFQTLAYLTEIDETKQLLKLKLDKLMDFLIRNSESASPAMKKLLLMQVQNIMDSERVLLEIHESYLNK
jgi:hypothetical protein